MSEAPRVAPGTRAELGAVVWGIVRALGLAARTGPPNLFATLGRRRGLFLGWLVFASRLMPFGVLPRRETELVILRVAHLRRCRYERDHHRRLGARAGLTEADFARIEQGPDADGLSPRERALLRATDALHADGDLTDATFEELRAYLDEAACVELVMLVGHYEMLATTIRALRIAPDARR